MEKVSCIIPCRNEAKRIGNVLKVVYNHPLLREVLVIQNFSTDNTSNAVKTFIKEYKAKKVRLVEENEYPGKACAMYCGVKRSKYPIILFIDADLKKLSEKNIADLVIPIIKKQADQTISIGPYTPPTFKLFGVDPTSGQRAMRKALFLEMPDYSKSKYSIESLINEFMIQNKKTIWSIKFKNVKHITKLQKYGLKGVFMEIKMFSSIFKAISLQRFARQLLYLSKHAKKV